MDEPNGTVNHPTPKRGRGRPRKGDYEGRDYISRLDAVSGQEAPGDLRELRRTNLKSTKLKFDSRIKARAERILDSAVVPALQTLLALLESENEMVRLQASKAILAKRIPDMTANTGERGDITINVVYASGKKQDSPSVQVFERNGSGT